MSAALPLVERLWSIDPYEKMTIMIQAFFYAYDGQYDSSLKACKKLYEMYPEDPYHQLNYALNLINQKKTNDALSIIDHNAKANPDSVFAKLGLMLKYGIQNDKAKANKVMTPDFMRTCQRDPTFCPLLAGVFSMLHEREKALEWLENAVDAGLVNYPLLAEKDPLLENIRGEPRFKKLMERVKHEWENFEV